MTMPVQINHLIDDLALGGVTRALDIFEHSLLRGEQWSHVVPVSPKAELAGRFDADIVMTHFSPSWRAMPFLYSLRAQNPRARLVHVEHSYSREWAERHVPSPGRFSTLLKLAYANFDAVVCVSHAQAEWLAAFTGLDARRFTVIEPWSETAGLTDLPLPKLDGKSGITIGAYGRFVEEKGFADLIRCWLQMPEGQNMQLLIGGFGPQQEELRFLADESSSIAFYGKVTDHAEFLSLCDCIAIPSHYEAFGMVAAEAKQAGRPIIASPVGGLREQVGKAGLLVDFSKPDTAASILAHLPELRLRSMAHAAREDCVFLEQWRAMKWHRLLGNLMSENTLSLAA